MTPEGIRSAVESVLFISETPLSLDRLCTIFEEFDRAAIKTAIEEIKAAFDHSGHGFFLADVANGYQFRSRPENADYLRRLTKGKIVKFSQSSLETLAIIAYRQPITRAEIEYLRGVDAGGVIKSLLEKKLIRILGKKDIPGKPLIYGTTREFLETFNLKELASLPTLKEIQELAGTEDDQQCLLPLDEGQAEAEDHPAAE